MIGGIKNYPDLKVFKTLRSQRNDDLRIKKACQSAKHPACRSGKLTEPVNMLTKACHGTALSGAMGILFLVFKPVERIRSTACSRFMGYKSGVIKIQGLLKKT